MRSPKSAKIARLARRLAIANILICLTEKSQQESEYRIMKVTPVLLLILDGFGYREDTDYNAIAHAHKPNWDKLWNNYPHTLVNASELSVGLPRGQMGNSEVGHLNIGAGRVVYQDLTRIDIEVENGAFFTNPALVQAVETAKEHNSVLHIMGLLSPGGVHSHESHFHAMLELAVRAGLKKILVHAFLDGRDTPPRSAAESLQKMQNQCAIHGAGRIASICGRFFAMDRDNRWERVQIAYDMLTLSKAPFTAADPLAGLEAAYARGENDEFVQATVIGQPAAMQDGDVLVFMNFRADRAREITRALTDDKFDGFARTRFPKLASYVTLSSYGDEFQHLPTAYKPESIHNGIGEYLSGLGLKQLRIAETEKYAHVTYFMSGGREQPYPGEDRMLVPSPKVATYDLKPEMSAFEVSDKLEAAISSKQYQAILCNYANGDMVGHSGNMDAAVKAVEALDICVGRVVKAMQAIGGEVIITADHGNAEQMIDRTTHQAHTAHTLNLVPFLYIGRKANLVDGGALQDIAPSLLAMMGVPQPSEMTGKSLIRFQ
jgi:2,3-bisphosphoglycerate-independent phosphoglycerate mutase